MSNARKLQTEIDRVMKKVDEGVGLFDEIWEKVYSAEQQNQKEKYEMDLKKEIKKLQRLRDQIKTWIGSSDVKDKDALLDARKLIETKMEQFKICEKETKTKTYSKEGLARAEKLDPAEEAKLNTTKWISEYIEKLQGMVEETDFEIEKLSSGKGKKTNRHQIEGLNEHITNHKYHISKLEGIIRLVNNDRLDVDLVNEIREDLDYYLEDYDDDDFMQAYDEEMFYEALGLDELDVVNVDRVTQAQAVKKEKDDTTSTSSRGSKDKKATKKSAISSIIPTNIGRARASKGDKKEKEETTPVKVANKGVSISVIQTNGSAPQVRTPSSSSAPPAGASMAAILKRESEQQEKERQQKLREAQAELQRQRQQQEAQLRQQEALRQQQAQQEALKRQQQEVLRKQQEAAQLKLQAQQQASDEQKAQLLQTSQVQPPKSQSSIGTITSSLGNLGLGTAETRSDAESVPLVAPSITQSSGSLDSGSTLLSALNDSFVTAPGNGEVDRNRQYSPQNPYPIPSSYPSTPSPLLDNPAVFEKLGTDCLFFIFYYAQGSYQQYLAARELKKQSWRFHKKYMTWFQRHEEPKVTTDEYEQGTYVYFDYETGWCTRIKTDFRFEYSYLEDSLQ